MIERSEPKSHPEVPPKPPFCLSDSSGPPPSIIDQANCLASNQLNYLIAAEADLSLSGLETSVWLFVSEDALCVVPTSRFEEENRFFSLSALEGLDLHGTVGSSSLRAKVDGAFVDLARFTNQYRERFQRVLVQIRLLKQGKDVQADALLAPDAMHCATCGMVLPDPNAPCGRCLDQGAVMLRTLKMLRPYYGWVALLFMIMIVGVSLDLIPNLLIRYLVDDVLNVQGILESGIEASDPQGLSRRRSELLLIVLGLLLAALARQGLNVSINRISSSVGTRLTYDVRTRMFRKLTEMTVDFYDRTQVGSLMSRITGDVEQFHGFVSQAAQGFLINVLMILGIGGMLFYLNPSLAPWVLAPIPLVILGTMYFWRRIYPRYFRLWDSHSKLNAMLNGVFSGIRLVKSFAQEQRERKRFDANVTYFRESRRSLDVHLGTFNPVMAFVFGIGGWTVWYLGGMDVLLNGSDSGGNSMTIGTLIAYIGYIAMFYVPVTNLALLSHWVSGFVTSSHRIFEVLDNAPSLNDPPDPVTLNRVMGRIEFCGVTFGYDPYNPVLHDVSFVIEPGELVGIVGRSGSGKTTLINLINRFYDPQEGGIYLDGHDLRDLRREDLREHIGLVLQEPFLFRDTVAENIRYGKPQASPVEILNASKAANCHDFVMRLPSGYDTRLGERGAGVSAGERQRLSIARALLCDPDVLILDEATSNVDVESEAQIQGALTILCKDRTTIAIAHRLSTLRGADKILVIENGRIAESGSHEELMARRGIYSHLVRMQTDLTRLEG